MRSYKNITFAEGISCTLSEFKKTFAPHLKKLNESEVKEAHKEAIKGNGKLSNSSKKGDKTNTSEDK